MDLDGGVLELWDHSQTVKQRVREVGITAEQELADVFPKDNPMLWHVQKDGILSAVDTSSKLYTLREGWLIDMGGQRYRITVPGVMMLMFWCCSVKVLCMFRAFTILDVVLCWFLIFQFDGGSRLRERIDSPRLLGCDVRILTFITAQPQTSDTAFGQGMLDISCCLIIIFK